MPLKKSFKFGNVAQSATIVVVNAVFAVWAFVGTGFNFGNPYTWIFVGGAALGVILNVAQSLAGGPFKGTHIGSVLTDFARVLTDLVNVVREALPILLEITKTQKANPLVSEAASLTQTTLQEFDAAPAIIAKETDSPVAAMVSQTVATVATTINDTSAPSAVVAAPTAPANQPNPTVAGSPTQPVVATLPTTMTTAPLITIGPSPIAAVPDRISQGSASVSSGNVGNDLQTVTLSAFEAAQLATLIGKLTTVANK